MQMNNHQTHQNNYKEKIAQSRRRASQKTYEVDKKSKYEGGQEHKNEELKKTKNKNEELTKENAELKQKCLQMQEMTLRDKEKIKNLIIRIN